MESNSHNYMSTVLDRIHTLQQRLPPSEEGLVATCIEMGNLVRSVLAIPPPAYAAFKTHQQRCLLVAGLLFTFGTFFRYRRLWADPPQRTTALANVTVGLTTVAVIHLTFRSSMPLWVGPKKIMQTLTVYPWGLM